MGEGGGGGGGGLIMRGGRGGCLAKEGTKCAFKSGIEAILLKLYMDVK